MLAHAASSESDPAVRANLLVSAGGSAAKAGDFAKAEEHLRAAMALDPVDPDSYHYLATMIFAPRKQMDSARAAIEQGISAGADPFTLDLALADAAGIAGDNTTIEKALLDATNIRPSDDDAAARLADLYMQEKRYDDAVLLLKRTAELHPDSAPVLNRLGRAEAANYQFYAAGNDLARATQTRTGRRGIQIRLRRISEKSRRTGWDKRRRLGRSIAKYRCPEIRHRGRKAASLNSGLAAGLRVRLSRG